MIVKLTEILVVNCFLAACSGWLLVRFVRWPNGFYIKALVVVGFVYAFIGHAFLTVRSEAAYVSCIGV